MDTSKPLWKKAIAGLGRWWYLQRRGFPYQDLDILGWLLFEYSAGHPKGTSVLWVTTANPPVSTRNSLTFNDPLARAPWLQGHDVRKLSAKRLQAESTRHQRHQLGIFDLLLFLPGSARHISKASGNLDPLDHVDQVKFPLSYTTSTLESLEILLTSSPAGC